MTRTLLRVIDMLSARILQSIVDFYFPRLSYATNIVVSSYRENNCPSTNLSLSNIFSSFLWAVPKHRKTVEKRSLKKHRLPYFRDAVPRRNMIPCSECGQWHDPSTICENCYKKVREETERLQKALPDRFHYNWPEGKEIKIQYTDDHVDEDDNKKVASLKQITESKNNQKDMIITTENTDKVTSGYESSDSYVLFIDKKRPQWFSKNLLQPTNKKYNYKR